MDQTDRIARAIEQFQAVGLPVVVAGPAAESAIRELEAAFGQTMPPSYRAFLSRFGALSVGDAHVAGIAGSRIDGGPDRAWHLTQLLREQHALPADVLVIEAWAAPPACLDFGRRRLDGEVPVARFDAATGVDPVTDPSFGEWLPAWLHARACDRELL